MIKRVKSKEHKDDILPKGYQEKIFYIRKLLAGW